MSTTSCEDERPEDALQEIITRLAKKHINEQDLFPTIDLTMNYSIICAVLAVVVSNRYAKDMLQGMSVALTGLHLIARSVSLIWYPRIVKNDIKALDECLKNFESFGIRPEEKCAVTLRAIQLRSVLEMNIDGLDMIVPKPKHTSVLQSLKKICLGVFGLG